MYRWALIILFTSSIVFAENFERNDTVYLPQGTKVFSQPMSENYKPDLNNSTVRLTQRLSRFTISKNPLLKRVNSGIEKSNKDRWESIQYWDGKKTVEEWVYKNNIESNPFKAGHLPFSDFKMPSLEEIRSCPKDLTFDYIVRDTEHKIFNIYDALGKAYDKDCDNKLIDSYAHKKTPKAKSPLELEDYFKCYSALSPPEYINNYKNEYRHHIQKSSKAFGLPHEVFSCLIYVESDHFSNNDSHTGAKGMGQITAVAVEDLKRLTYGNRIKGSNRRRFTDKNAKYQSMMMNYQDLRNYEKSCKNNTKERIQLYKSDTDFTSLELNELVNEKEKNIAYAGLFLRTQRDQNYNKYFKKMKNIKQDKTIQYLISSSTYNMGSGNLGKFWKEYGLTKQLNKLKSSQIIPAFINNLYTCGEKKLKNPGKTFSTLTERCAESYNHLNSINNCARKGVSVSHFDRKRSQGKFGCKQKLNKIWKERENKKAKK